MRKYVVLAALFVAAFAAIDAASASAELVGTCQFHGSSEFTPSLNTELKERGYTFTSSAGGALKVGGEGAECIGVNSETNAPETKTGKATVSGKGQLQCLVAAGGALEVNGEVEGKGTLTLAGTPHEFTFKFVAAGGTVHFTTKGGVVSHGTASFLLSKEQEAKECANGVKNLEFEASAHGVVK
jgi:hypothetical protein